MTLLGAKPEKAVSDLTELMDTYEGGCIVRCMHFEKRNSKNQPNKT